MSTNSVGCHLGQSTYSLHDKKVNNKNSILITSCANSQDVYCGAYQSGLPMLTDEFIIIYNSAPL